MKKLQTWSLKSSWSDARNRFQIFKEQNPSAQFEFNNNIVNVKDFDDWDSVKRELKVRKGTNPHRANINILIDGKLTPLESIIRPDKRSSGYNATKMEKSVILTTLLNATNVDELVKLSESVTLNELIKRTGLQVDEIEYVLERCKIDPEYVESFIRVGQNIRGSIDEDFSNYKALESDKWNDLKTVMSEKLSAYLKQKVKADKWNPADVLFIQGDFDLKSFLKETENMTITDFNALFADLVHSKKIIPVSIKQKASSIKGSKGITKELVKNVQDITLSEIIDEIGSNKAEDIPIFFNYDDNVVSDFTIQKKALLWIKEKGREYVERVAAIAFGIIEGSSIFYEISDTHCRKVFEDSKKNPELIRVIVCLDSQAIWLEFDNPDIFTVIRSDGSTIRTLIEKQRNYKKVKTFKGVIPLIKDSKHPYLLKEFNIS